MFVLTHEPPVKAVEVVLETRDFEHPNRNRWPLRHVVELVREMGERAEAGREMRAKAG